MRIYRCLPFFALGAATLIAACSGGSGALNPPSGANPAISSSSNSSARQPMGAATATPRPISSPTPLPTATPAPIGCRTRDRDDCHKFILVKALVASIDRTGTLAFTDARHGDHWFGRFDDDNGCRHLDLDDAPAFTVASVNEVSVSSFTSRWVCRHRRHDDAAMLHPMSAKTPGPTATPSPTPAPTPQGKATNYYVVMATGTDRAPVVVALIGPAYVDQDHDWLVFQPVVKSVVLQPSVGYHFFIAKYTDRDDPVPTP